MACSDCNVSLKNSTFSSFLGVQATDFELNFAQLRCDIGFQDAVGFIGAPCVAHSKLLVRNISVTFCESSGDSSLHTCIPRMGNGEKFDNENVKKCHDVATAFIKRTRLALHENVTEFDEAWHLF